MSLYDNVRDLPLTVEGYGLEGLEQQVSSGFLRKTTIIRLHGPARRVSARTSPTRRPSTIFPRRRGRFTTSPESGRSTRSRSISTTLELFDHEPDQHAYLDYRRWGYESAALDLALRQAGLSLGAAVGRQPEPLTFVVSMRLGEPPTTDRFNAWLAHYPGLRFKLDADARLVRGADRRARARPAPSTRSTSRGSTTARASTPCPTPRSTRGSSPVSRTPGSRTPHSRPRRCAVLEPENAASPGMR